MIEKIVFVDNQGSPTGEVGPKLESHHDNTKLHLAFSCYVFNKKGQFLVTQRAFSKKVWPGVWTNSVCGHPAPGEDIVSAIERRLQFELGMTAKDFLVGLPTYTYKTPPYNGIIEHEFCPVYFATATSEPKPNPDEVAGFRWVDWIEFTTAAEADGKGNGGYCPWMKSLPKGEARKLGIWSWWCKDQLKQLKDNSTVRKYSKTQDPKSI